MGFAAWDKKRRDSVSGTVYPLCSCKARKAFNDQPLECELNKFDDMMRLLHQTVRCFTQVVAVDRQFSIFNRAWCVAELVEADACDMPQIVCVSSQTDFEQNQA